MGLPSFKDYANIAKFWLIPKDPSSEFLLTLISLFVVSYNSRLSPILIILNVLFKSLALGESKTRKHILVCGSLLLSQTIDPSWPSTACTDH